MISLFLAPLAWLLMAFGIVGAIKALTRGGALAVVTRTLLVEVWRRGVLPIGGAILFVGLGLLPLLLGASTDVDSRIHTLLDYGQGWIAATLLLLSLLMSCGSYCDEVVTGRIRWLVVRPGSRWTLLPGKLLGILVALLVLLLPATLLLMSLVSMATDSTGLLWNPVSVAIVTPETLDVSDEDVDRYLALLIMEDPRGWGGLEPEQAQSKARSRLERRSRSISDGASREYFFRYPAGLEKGAVISIRPSLGRTHRSERARFRFHLGGESQEVIVRNGERSTVEVPESLTGATEINLDLEFLGAIEEDARIPAVIWSGSDAFELRVPAGSLVSSLIRSQLLTWIRCGFIAALGLAVSTFLGMPVATLLVLCFLVAAAGGGFTGAFDAAGGHSHGDPHDQDPSRIVIDLLAYGGEWIVGQLSSWNQHATADRVAAGENVTFREVIRGFASIGLLWAGVTLLLGIWISDRQEHGLGRDR
ncbi:MAG: hypothetical protein HRU16_08875 [Planctomycetes bacterium]|nr:hypothetical protein [Planctomycetota bacterium]